MSTNDIINAWKNDDFFNSLSEEQRSSLPENPAGIVELSDVDMEIIAGGSGPVFNITNNGGDCDITNGFGADCFNFS